MIRGIVAPSALIEPWKNGFVMQRGLTQEELRYYLLYWDKVVVPGNNLINLGLPDEATLIQTGVLTRPRVVIQGGLQTGGTANVFILAQAIAAKQLIEGETDTDWVVHQIGTAMALPPEFRTTSRTVRMKLENLLPVPAGDIPIIDILDFKERRSAELGYLHQCIDELCVEVISSPDPAITEKGAVTRLKDAIQNLDSVSSERWKKTRKFDFSAELNIDASKIATGAAAGAAFAFYSAGVDIQIGTILGGIASAIKLNAKVSATFEPAKNQMKLGYLSLARHDNII